MPTAVPLLIGTVKESETPDVVVRFCMRLPGCHINVNHQFSVQSCGTVWTQSCGILDLGPAVTMLLNGCAAQPVDYTMKENWQVAFWRMCVIVKDFLD